MAGSANRPLHAEALAEFISFVNASFDRVVPLLPEDERTDAGGTFSLTDIAGWPYLAFQIGHPPMGKRPSRWARALEKPLRAACAGDKTSRPTRNEERDRWAGSLYGDLTGLRGGFSGFPEDFDEILVADVLVRTGDLSPGEALRQLADNPTFRKVVDYFSWAKP